MIKIFLIFFFSMHIANNLSATDVPEQLFVERTTLYSAYDSRTDRIICDPAKLAEFRAKTGSIQTTVSNWKNRLKESNFKKEIWHEEFRNKNS